MRLLITTAHLLLAIISKSNGSQSLVSEALASIDIAAQEYLLAPELFDNHDFALVTVNQTLKPSEIAMSEIKIIGPNNTISKCFLPVMPEENVTNLGIRDIRRLSKRTILLETYHEFENSRHKMKLVLMDMINCSISRPYNEYLPSTHAIFTSNNSSEPNGKFTVLMYGNEHCHGHNWCRLFFDPYYQKFESLNFDFPWKGVEIEPVTSFDGNLFVVRINNASDAYKIRLYDIGNKWTTPRYKELFSVPSVKSHNVMYYYNYQSNDVKSMIKSSDLAICWTPSTNETTETRIDCSAFKEDGHALFNKTLFYPDSVELLHVKSILNGLVLFTKKSQCRGEDCLNVYVAVITNQFYCTSETCSDLYSSSMPLGDEIVQIKYRKLKVACFYLEALKTYRDLRNGTIVGEYLCDNGYKLTYHTLTVD